MDIETSNKWLKSAFGNLMRGKIDNYINDNQIPIELFCFDLQQCIEKSIKSIFILNQIDFVYTHDIATLLKHLNDKLGINIPDYVLESVWISKYAFKTRYPGDWEPISEEEYNQALELTEKVYNWAKEIVEKTQ